MAENALIVNIRRASRWCKKRGVALFVAALVNAAWCEPARADSAVPDIRLQTAVPDIKLQPRAKANQDDAKKNATKVPVKNTSKSTTSESRITVVPEIVLQPTTPRPIKVASKANAKPSSKAPIDGATAGCSESAVADSPNSASDSETLVAQTQELPLTGESKNQEAARPTLKHTAGQASSGTQTSTTIQLTAATIEDSQPPAIQLAAPVNASDYKRVSNKKAARQLNYQDIEQLPAPTGAENQAAPIGQTPDPCAAVVGRPFHDFGINTAIPEGQLPVDVASSCWVNVNASAGPFPGQRAWAGSMFAWDATCLCYRPLYFEEVNLERYGYGCCETMQPLASAAHFFGTIPLLPYCMAVDCPNECNYSLGHYRPGSCGVPKRYMWPPVSPRAILAEGGIWTGMVFLIP